MTCEQCCINLAIICLVNIYMEFLFFKTIVWKIFHHYCSISGMGGIIGLENAIDESTPNIGCDCLHLFQSVIGKAWFDFFLQLWVKSSLTEFSILSVGKKKIFEFKTLGKAMRKHTTISPKDVIKQKLWRAIITYIFKGYSIFYLSTYIYIIPSLLSTTI